MSTHNLADLIDKYNEIKGTLSYKPDHRKLSDTQREQVIFCDKTVGDSHFSLVRTKEFEIIFTHSIGKKVNRSCLDMNSFHSEQEPTLLIHWEPDFCELRWNYNTRSCDFF